MDIKKIRQDIERKWSDLYIENSTLVVPSINDQSFFYRTIDANECLKRDIAHVNQVNEIPSNLHTDFPEYPGVTQPELPKSIDRHHNDQVAGSSHEFISKELHWYTLFDTSCNYGCYVHTPGYVADNTIFNDIQYYTFYKDFGEVECMADKKIKVIPEYCTTNVKMSSKRRTVTIVLNGWSAKAFQHFLIEVPPRLAMIYDFLMENMNNSEFQIVIIGPLDNNPDSVQSWFWERVGLAEHVQYDTVGWCKKHDWTYYSSLLIQPFFATLTNKYQYTLYPRGVLAPIQHLLTDSEAKRNVILYMPRAADGLRSIKNQHEVIECIQKWVTSNNEKMNGDWEFVSFEPQGFDKDSVLVSRAIMIIGPHGGKFANLVFAQPDTYVLEFNDVLMEKNNSTKYRSDYYALSQAASLHYWCLKPQGMSSYFAQNMIIDTGKLTATLSLMYADMTQRAPHLTSVKKIRTSWPEKAINVQPSDTRVRCFTLYTHSNWLKYSWESMNDSSYMIWDVRRCYYGDPHPHPNKYEKVFYTDSELCHARRHQDVIKIAFMLECRYITPDFYDYLEENIDVFDSVLTHDAYLLAKYPGKCIFYPHGNCVIKKEDFEIYQKDKLVSFISSTKRMNVSGHHLRHLFHELYSNRTKNWTRFPIGDTIVDLYGSLAGNFIEYKLESLKDYMFQIVVENSVLDTYFTEKIIDCFVTGTVPLYYGTKKITDYFDPQGIIQFSTIEELFEILGKLTPEMYYSRRDAVARNFKLAQQYIIPEDWIFENTDIFK